jgi:hypothetical protein
LADYLSGTKSQTIDSGFSQEIPGGRHSDASGSTELSPRNHLVPLDAYVSCHWPIKKGREIAEFCQETRAFVQRADLLLKSAGITNMREACLELGPQLGDWPESIHLELAYALAGHLGLQ